MDGRTLRSFVEFAISRAAARGRGVPTPVMDAPTGLLNPFATDRGADKVPFAYAMELIPAVYSCITKLQDTVTGLPLVIMDGEKPQERIPRNAAYLFGNANPYETGDELIGQLVGSQCWRGIGYLFWNYDGQPVPQELWCLNPDRVKTIPFKGKRGILRYDCDLGNGKTQEVPPWQITRFPRYSPRHGYEGLSPLQVAQVAYTTQRNAMLWLDQHYRKGGAVAGYLTPDAEHGLSLKEEERLVSVMRTKFQGIKRALDPVVLPRGVKFEKAALTMREMQFLETHKLTNADIYNIFGIPPVIMGVKEGGGLSDAGASTDLILFYRNCIMPICRRIQSVINERVFMDLIHIGEFGFGLSCKFDFSGVPVLQLERLTLMEKATVANGGDVPFTMNEFRAAAGFELSPKKEHDEIPPRATEVTVQLAADAAKAASAGAPEGGGKNKGKQASSMDGDPPVPADSPSFALIGPAREHMRAQQGARVVGQQRFMAKGVGRLGRQIEDRLVARLKTIFEPQAAAPIETEEPTTHVVLAKEWSDYLAQQPEWGMGVHIVVAEFADAGSRAGLPVLNRARLVLPLSLAELAITGIQVDPNPPLRHSSRAAVRRLKAAIDGEDLLQATREDRALMRRYHGAVAQNAGYQQLADVGLTMGFKVRGERFTRGITDRVEIMIVGTTRTTRKLVADTIAEGVSKNETPPEIIARAREVVRERYYGQSTVIVRTETMAAWNYGAQEAWLQANEANPGLIDAKEWVTEKDELVRGAQPKDKFDHVAADGLTVAIDKPFIVSGESLMHPGDHTQGASAGNTIMCRCVAVPRLSPAGEAARILKFGLAVSTLHAERTPDDDATLEEIFG